MSKDVFPNKVIWLASYPKSGNTWFRAFMTALFGEGEIEINHLKTDAIFSSREIFEQMCDVDSAELYEDEIRLMQPIAIKALAEEQPRTFIMKVHDAYSYNSEGEPIIPTEATHCAIYLIRNPLDVVGSFANHNAGTIDDAIALMNYEQGTLAGFRPRKSLNNQIAQLMYSWSGHVNSWTTKPDFPVHVIRYEDMNADPFNTFKKAIQDIGWNYTDEQIARAVEATSFEKLSSQEKEKGFQEKNARSAVFFRSGKSGNWKNELTEEQAKLIIDAHREVMAKYDYLPGS